MVFYGLFGTYSKKIVPNLLPHKPKIYSQPKTFPLKMLYMYNTKKEDTTEALTKGYSNKIEYLVP